MLKRLELLSRIRERWSINSSRVHLEKFVKRAASTVGTGDRVLDAGAGDCMYRLHFSQVNYEAADLSQVKKAYGELTYICDLRSIPVAKASYDLVLLTQVLEHLPEPADVLMELSRVLKTEGRLWLSAPLFYREHEQPYDFKTVDAEAGMEILGNRIGEVLNCSAPRGMSHRWPRLDPQRCSH